MPFISPEFFIEIRDLKIRYGDWGTLTMTWGQSHFLWCHHLGCSMAFPLALTLLFGTAKCLDCCTLHYVTINWHFVVPENKVMAGGKAALQLGWWSHQMWFWPRVTIVAPLRSESYSPYYFLPVLIKILHVLYVA